MDSDEGLTGLHAVADGGEDLESHGRIDLIAQRPPASSQRDGSHADFPGIEAFDPPDIRGGELGHDRCRRELLRLIHDERVASLAFDEPPQPVERRAVVEQ